VCPLFINLIIIMMMMMIIIILIINGSRCNSKLKAALITDSCASNNTTNKSQTMK